MLGKITPNFLKVVHVFVSSFSFFPDIKSKHSFLGGLKLQPHHTIPQHWKQAKDFQECLGPGLSSEASLFLFLSVFCWCYSNFLRPFASTSLHRLLSLQKKRNTWFCLRCAGLFCLSNYYAGCRCLVLVPRIFFTPFVFFLGMSYARFFFSFCIHKPSSATKLAKKRNTWFCLRCAGLLCLSNYYLGCRCLVLVAQDFLHGLCFFFGVLLQFFLAFGSGSLHRLQGLQKKNIREEPTKQRRALSNVLAQDFVQRLCFFLGGLPPVFCFGSGSLHRLLR